MGQWMPRGLEPARNMKWRHRDREISARRAPEPLAKATELLDAVRSALQRDDLSTGARTLLSALHFPDDYVVCIDPPRIAAAVGVSEQKITIALNELTRAGVIASRIGNLVFFA